MAVRCFLWHNHQGHWAFATRFCFGFQTFCGIRVCTFSFPRVCTFPFPRVCTFSLPRVCTFSDPGVRQCRWFLDITGIDVAVCDMMLELWEVFCFPQASCILLWIKAWRCKGLEDVSLWARAWWWVSVGTRAWWWENAWIRGWWWESARLWWWCVSHWIRGWGAGFLWRWVKLVAVGFWELEARKFFGVSEDFSPSDESKELANGRLTNEIRHFARLCGYE